LSLLNGTDCHREKGSLTRNGWPSQQGLTPQLSWRVHQISSIRRTRWTMHHTHHSHLFHRLQCLSKHCSCSRNRFNDWWWFGNGRGWLSWNKKWWLIYDAGRGKIKKINRKWPWGRESGDGAPLQRNGTATSCVNRDCRYSQQEQGRIFENYDDLRATAHCWLVKSFY